MKYTLTVSDEDEAALERIVSLVNAAAALSPDPPTPFTPETYLLSQVQGRLLDTWTTQRLDAKQDAVAASVAKLPPQAEAELAALFTKYDVPVPSDVQASAKLVPNTIE